MALTDRIRSAVVSAASRASDADTLSGTQEQLRKRRRRRERDRAEQQREQRRQRRGEQREQAQQERSRQQRREAASDAVDEATKLAQTTRVGRRVSQVSRPSLPTGAARNVLSGAVGRARAADVSGPVGIQSRDDDVAQRAERAAASPAVISDATLDPFGGDGAMAGPTQLQMMVGGVGKPARGANPLVVDDQIVGAGRGRGRREPEQQDSLAAFVTGGSDADPTRTDSDLASFVVGGQR